jgi:hypothetical protein
MKDSEKKTDRLSHIIQTYLDGELELATAAAEITHVYLERGWRFSLVEAECDPRHYDRMRALAERVEAALDAEMEGAPAAERRAR